MRFLSISRPPQYPSTNASLPTSYCEKKKTFHAKISTNKISLALWIDLGVQGCSGVKKSLPRTLYSLQVTDSTSSSFARHSVSSECADYGSRDLCSAPLQPCSESSTEEMIIPVRCFSCGKVGAVFLACGWLRLTIVAGHRGPLGTLHGASGCWRWRRVSICHVELLEQKVENICVSDAMDQLGCKRYCCRRMLMTHVDLIEKLLAYGTVLENLVSPCAKSYRYDPSERKLKAH